MGKRSQDRSNKRRFGSGKGAHHPTPRRGPPAIFVTCESGRERKCQREALDLIHHYYYSSRSSATQKATAVEEEGARGGEECPPPASPSAKTKSTYDEELSLEEELSMLRKGAAAEEVLSYEPDSKRPRHASKNGASSKEISSMKSPFSIYDLGVRGMVCIMCTLPGCEMVPYDDILAKFRAKKEKDGDNITKDGSENGDVKEDEGIKDGVVDEELEGGKPAPPDTGPPLWDAVETVRCIMRDASRGNDVRSGINDVSSKSGQKNNDEGEGAKESTISKERSASPPPGSRFITRILPMQATCYASVEEIKAVSISLLKRCLSTFPAILSKKDGEEETTFKIEIKRRLCSHLTRDDVIGAITPALYGGLDGEMPDRKFKVNLSDPDFTVRIETCKSLCGISILPRDDWYRNFNLAELANPSSDGNK
eukprot:CAMPEP_0172527706 /NCGR_PEP_ID=MMETSP1067-20121228/2325_1 /TAXON_ID=265564 ORGANISM="Thalassiosira punctigera, Strain Tpunct2005C2" /NCGR_SAMPLE_ID=MMETSP1067 /ASSEMBLY_ACC=CAM_ASM_000444 /LENGTH=424 /DNA_ID=CAMNT_0013311499 /DNA_START=16 /DNA_END=1290 /DNA_ORIENTATION=+